MAPASGRVHPIRITLAYVLAGSAWIAGSDLLVASLPNTALLSIAKGWLFVAVTGLLLYFLLYRVRRSLLLSEEETRITETRFRKLVESAPEGIYFRTGSRFQYVNPAALRILGAATADQLEGTPVLARFPPHLRPFITQKMRHVDEQREALPPLELQILRLDGSLVDVELTSVPMEYGRLRGSLVYFRDLTERKRAQEESRQLEEQFRQAQKMESLGRLAGGIAHDFNNYLTVINGFSDLLIHTLPSGSPVLPRINQIRSAGERAALLTRQLLSFTRRDAAALTVFDINEEVREFQLISARLVEENIQVVFELCDEPCPVYAGRGSIEQVLMNLLVNARDAMPNGGLATIRTVLEATSPSRVLLEVSDTGSGMDPEIQKRIFEPFFSTKNPGEGTGLGLSIVYNVVSQSNGTIEVASEVNRGSVFRIRLPLCELPPVDQTEPISVPLPGPAIGTVLLVEDQDEVRDFVAQTLSLHGYSVLAAASGSDALQLAENESGAIHLLLTDVVMPLMSGPELARRLHLVRPELRVLYMSGYSASLLDSQADSVIPKPFTPELLLRRVAESIHATVPGTPPSPPAL